MALLSAKQHQFVAQTRGAATALPCLPCLPRRPAVLFGAPRSAALLKTAAVSGAELSSAPLQAAADHQASSTACCSSSGSSGQQQHQQQQHHHRHQRPGVAPFASLTRVLLTSQAPSNLVRQLIAGRSRFAGPVGLLLFLCGLLLALLSGVRAALVRRVKACQCCRGYGIVRCRLCDGRGSVEWMAKNLHQENCPLCMTRRFVTCPDCGGFHHRKMFVHVPATSTSRGLVPDLLG